MPRSRSRPGVTGRLPGRHGGLRWHVRPPTFTIRLGAEKQGVRRPHEGASELAADVAVADSRPAWLLDETGYPMTPIERGTIH